MMRVTFAVSALLASAPNCADLYSIGTHGFAVPTLFSRSAAAAPAGSALAVAIDLGAHNPNPFPISLDGVDYDATLEGLPAFSGTQKGFSVSGNGDGTLALRGSLDTSSAAYRALRPGATAHYVLGGTVHVASPAGVPVDVEFSVPGTFVVPSALPAAR